MIYLYHGGTKENLNNIVKTEQYEEGYGEYEWGGLWASDSIEMAKSYGESVIKILIESCDEYLLQQWVVDPTNYEVEEEWMYDAVEYLIPKNIKFQAMFVE